MRKLYNNIRVMFKSIKNLFTKKIQIDAAVEDFITQDKEEKEVRYRLEYILSMKKLNHFDVYDLIKTVTKLSTKIHNEKSIYQAVVATTSEMSVELNSLLDSIMYYSGIISTFNSNGCDYIDSEIKKSSQVTTNKIKNLELENNSMQVKIVELKKLINENNAAIIDVTNSDIEYKKNMLKVKSYFTTISNTYLNDLKLEREKCVKYL